MRTMCSLMALTVAMSACSEARLPIESTPSGTAQVQLMNALSPALAASVTLDGAPVPMPVPGTALARSVEAGAHRLEVRGANNVLLGSSAFTLAAGSRRAIVLGGGAGPGITLLETTFDSVKVPLQDAARVRVVHTVDGLPSAAAYLGVRGSAADSANLLVTPFEFGAGSDAHFPGYAIRGPGSYTVRAMTRTTPSTLLAEQDLELAGGEVVDLVLVRLENGGLGWRVVRGT